MMSFDIISEQDTKPITSVTGNQIFNYLSDSARFIRCCRCCWCFSSCTLQHPHIVVLDVTYRCFTCTLTDNLLRLHLCPFPVVGKRQLNIYHISMYCYWQAGKTSSLLVHRGKTPRGSIHHSTELHFNGCLLLLAYVVANYHLRWKHVGFCLLDVLRSYVFAQGLGRRSSISTKNIFSINLSEGIGCVAVEVFKQKYRNLR